MKLPVTAIILVYNEEKNIKECIESVANVADQIFIVDSYSTDRTLDIIKNYRCQVIQHKFENYSAQRNWAFKNLPISNQWILNLDADHRITDQLVAELTNIFASSIPEEINGFMITRKLIFMGRWIKHGGLYPTYNAVLFRKDFGFCENRLYDQHFVIKGKSLVLKNAIIDIMTDSISRFIQRHNKWAIAESIEQLSDYDRGNQLVADKNGNEMQRRRYLRNKYNSSPIFFRSFFYFIYRYILKLGFLDGKEGLIYHVLQGFWYRFLVDSTIFEIKHRAKKEKKSLQTIINEYYLKS